MIGENRSSVELPIRIGVFENQHPIPLLEVETLRPFGVGVILGDPEPAARVPRHGDRVLNVRLGSEDGDVKPVRKAKSRRRLAGPEWPAGRLLGISRNGKVIRGGQSVRQNHHQGDKSEARRHSLAHSLTRMPSLTRVSHRSGAQRLLRKSSIACWI